MVNDYWDIAIDEGAAFIHLGQGDLDGADIGAIRGRACRLGVSTHDHAELDRALALEPDYVALGPIYPTHPQGDGLRAAGSGAHRRMEAAASADRPLVAIGGLNVERAPLCLAAGADSASVVTDITLNADPEGAGARLAGGDAEGGLNDRTPVALTIAGSDSGGGAGVQADLRTFAALGVYGVSAVTAVTAQNTRGVRAVDYLAAGIVARADRGDLRGFRCRRGQDRHAGRRGDRRIVAERLVRRRSVRFFAGAYGRLRRPMRAFLVYDPVMIASSGDALGGAGSSRRSKTRLLPLVDCLTPNLAEAAALLGGRIARERSGDDATGRGAAEARPARRADEGRPSRLRRGGRPSGDAGGVRRYAAPRLASRNLHGTGCTLSSADRGQCRSRDGAGGGGGGGQGFCRARRSSEAATCAGSGPAR